MRALRLPELRTILASPAFVQFWERLQAARIALSEREERYDELLAQTTLMEFRAELSQKNAIDTLYRAGEHEDRAATLDAQVQEVENRSFRGVSDFEEQRFRVSELWYRLGATEKERDEGVEAKLPQVEVGARGRRLQAAQAEYAREEARKAKLWEEVERLWAQSAETSLRMAEQKAQGKKVRREAEGLFQLAEDRKQKATALRKETDAAAAEVEAARAALALTLGAAGKEFDCAVGTDFLYFRIPDFQAQAWAVSLVTDREGYNVEVKALAVYLVDRQRGVLFLEPARAQTPSAEEGDRRFEAYFLVGRKGETRPGA
jgi:hypothetical protein